jgi:hypothetical protein
MIAQSQHSHGAHSAKVEMTLIVNGSSISITHMGPDFLLIEPDGEHPPGEANIVLQVDASERRWQVKLPDGISKQSRRVPLAVCE